MINIDTIPCAEIKESVIIEPETFTNSFGANSGIDHFDNVISVHSVPFSGYVYNLETLYHNYTATNTIFHNCRCVAQGIITEQILNNLSYNSKNKQVV
jgi:hypothetical protein